MSGFKKFIILVIVLIVASPFAAGALAFTKDAKVPAYFEEFNYQEFDSEQELKGRLDALLLNNVLGNKSLYLDEELVSKAIYASLKQSFNNEAVISGINATVSYDYTWVTFKDNILSFYGIIAYNNTETSFTIQLEFIDYEDSLDLKVHAAKIGKLPIPNGIFTKLLYMLENRNIISIKSLIKDGDVSYEDLQLTLNDDVINQYLEDYLDSDIIIFKAIELKNRKFILNYEFNPDNLQASAINDAANEIKSIISGQEIRNDISGVLDSNDENQAAFNENFDSALDLLNEKIESIESGNLADFEEGEEQVLKDLSDSYSTLPPEVQQDVIDVLTNSMDPDVKANFEANVLSEYSEYDSLDDFINQVFGGSNTTN